MTRVVLSIGSNVGDRLANLQSVLDGLGPAVLAVSPVYATAPWGGVEQAEFRNAVVLARDPARDARAWLAAGQDLERAADRRREVRWGPRTLDVDVVDCDGSHDDDPELTLPHPRAHERAFVLVPWLAVDPAAVLVGHGRVVDLVARLPEADLTGVRPVAETLVVRAGPAPRSSS